MKILSRFFVDGYIHKAKLLKQLTRPIPLPLINYFLNFTLIKVVKKNSYLFNRLVGHHHKTFLIQITNLPFDLVLQPNPNSPHLYAKRKAVKFDADATISGSFLSLLGMIDGRFDGDALFFTRDLQIFGDTEAIVCLRNALDDMDKSLADEAASNFSPIGPYFLAMARRATKNNDIPS